MGKIPIKSTIEIVWETAVNSFLWLIENDLHCCQVLFILLIIFRLCSLDIEC